MKSLLKLGIVIVISALLTVSIATEVKANTVVCRLTGLSCPQAIPGTSWVPSLGPVTSVPLKTYEQAYLSNIYGYRTNLLMDVEFTEEKKQRIKIAHSVGWSFTNPESAEAFKSCIRKYAKTHLFPEVGVSPKLSSDFANNLVALLEKTKGKDLRVNHWIPPQNTQKGAISLGQAEIGFDWIKKGFLIEDNPATYDGALHPNRFGRWGGHIIHEMMHNLGYDHPKWVKSNKDVEGSLTYEATWCIARKNQDKTPGAVELMLQDPNTSESIIPFYVD